MTVFKDNIIHNTTRIDFFSSTSSSFSGRHIFFTCSVLYRSQGAQGEVGFVDEIAKLREACDQPKRKIPSKIDPFLTSTQTKHHCHTDSYPLFAPSPNFPAFSFQLARLQGSSCYHRISGYEHGPANVVMPATSGLAHRRPCGSRPWTTRLKPRAKDPSKSEK